MKITKYILLFTVLFSFNLYGKKYIDKLNYEVSYEKALKTAKELNKPIMMLIELDSCPACNKFKGKTLRLKEIDEKIHNNFVALTVKQYIDIDSKEVKIKDISNKDINFKIKGSPTVLFIDPKKEKAFLNLPGYMRKSVYKEELDNALKIFNENVQ